MLSFLAAAAVAAVPHGRPVPSPVAADAVVPADRQWAAVEATARVSAGDVPGPVATAVCVGVSGGDAYLLTADHVIPSGQARQYEFFTRRSYPRPAFALVGSGVVVRVTGADLALVKVPLTGPERPGVLALAPAFDRPKRFPAAGGAVGCPDGLPPLVRAERITGKPFVRRPPDGDGFFWQTARAPDPGMSGGPLLDASGRVIGVCAAARGAGGYYTHLDEVHAALKRSGYGWLVPDAKSGP